MIDKQELACLDPYDPWTTKVGVKVKHLFYQGKLIGKLLAVIVAVIDWVLPNLSRQVMGARRIYYPITVAQWILAKDRIENPEQDLDLLMSTASSKGEFKDHAWGLGFPWMSKNGLYDKDLPFVTHTPYAMEALLRLSQEEHVGDRARQIFKETRHFLDRLLIMEESDETLALSYAPIEEPRIVVNANSYACHAYAMHYAYGSKDQETKERVIKLARWVVSQQNADGSWYYYADNDPGNFIDCFHSCFVLKNLDKAGKLVPEVYDICQSAYDKGLRYLDENFIDPKTGLAKRFVERDIKDPYVWDLYDQAEYLGMLIDNERLSEANSFKRLVDTVFQKGGNWFCRKDALGRLWGKNFYRWGIMPYFYQCARLAALSKEEKV